MSPRAPRIYWRGSKAGGKFVRKFSICRSHTGKLKTCRHEAVTPRAPHLNQADLLAGEALLA